MCHQDRQPGSGKDMLRHTAQKSLTQAAMGVCACDQHRCTYALARGQDLLARRPRCQRDQRGGLHDDTMPMQIVSKISNSGFALVLGRYGDDRNALRFVQQCYGLSDNPCPLKAAIPGNDDMVKEITWQSLAHD